MPPEELSQNEIFEDSEAEKLSLTPETVTSTPSVPLSQRSLMTDVQTHELLVTAIRGTVSQAIADKEEGCPSDFVQSIVAKLAPKAIRAAMIEQGRSVRNEAVGESGQQTHVIFNDYRYPDTRLIVWHFRGGGRSSFEIARKRQGAEDYFKTNEPFTRQMALFEQIRRIAPAKCQNLVIGWSLPEIPRQNEESDLREIVTLLTLDLILPKRLSDSGRHIYYSDHRRLATINLAEQGIIAPQKQDVPAAKDITFELGEFLGP